ncbi:MULTISPECIES: FtsH protease activity modulator HflK, partial [Paenibacillus]|uniref:Protein HflK n=1 Tax=Paenibacillus vandeheii TaxID=3035917 RepID=A0ABT8JFQ6_9BACL
MKITEKSLVFVLLGGFLLFNSTYTVQEKEVAVVTTFGKVTNESTQGLHLKWPWPIQSVEKVDANKTHRIEIGFRQDGDKAVSVESEALMITGDENIVWADAIVEYNISNAKNYLYNTDSPENFLGNATVAAIRSVIGSKKLDYVITEGKTEIQAEVKELLIASNDLYNTGIHILDVKFQDIEPPEGEVSKAFVAVTDAREEKNTKINQAEKHRNQVIPQARAAANAAKEQALSEKTERINGAKGDVKEFNAIYEEYKKNPQITKKRLILETIEKVYPKAKIFIVDGNGQTVNYLPLTDLTKK